MNAANVNWHEGRTAILPGVYQELCNYRIKTSAADATGDLSDTIRSRLRSCSDLVNYPRTFKPVYKCNLPSQGHIVNNSL